MISTMAVVVVVVLALVLGNLLAVRTTIIGHTVRVYDRTMMWGSRATTKVIDVKKRREVTAAVGAVIVDIAVTALVNFNAAVVGVIAADVGGTEMRVFAHEDITGFLSLDDAVHGEEIVNVRRAHPKATGVVDVGSDNATGFSVGFSVTRLAAAVNAAAVVADVCSGQGRGHPGIFWLELHAQFLVKDS